MMELKMLFNFKAISFDWKILWLVGAPWVPSTVLSAINCLHFVNDQPDYEAEADDLRMTLLGGLEVIGALNRTDSEDGIAVARKIRKILDFESTDDVIVGTKSQTGEFNFYCNGRHIDAFEVLENAEKDFWNQTCLFHSQISLRLQLNTSDYSKQLDCKLKEIVRKLGSSRAVFLVEGKSKRVTVKHEKRNSGMLISDFVSNETLKTPVGAPISRPVYVKALIQQSIKDSMVAAPVVHYIPGKCSIQNLDIIIDVLCLAKSNSEIDCGCFVRTISAQLRTLQKLLSNSRRTNTARQPKLRAYHFMLPEMLHPVTAIYDVSYGESEIQLIAQRRSLHSRFGLPLDRPLLRAANSLSLASPSQAQDDEALKRLIDVHIGLVPKVPGGRTSLVQGSYEYYHYLQDRFDDSGWGCAYRSLQTIVSWFRLQHYTSLPVPSHREIQRILVEIGDKEASFVGSREWIGAIEISFVLDKLLGVSSKVINVRSGGDLPEKCRQLAAHFQSQGTPVMIGGGVLAYTLLGVNYDELTGESSYLILDPHYKGGEDVRSIRSGGWCGWKNAVSEKGDEFFLRDKFYNLLLPQRPMTV